MRTKVLLALVSFVVLVASVLLFNTLRFTSRQVAVEPVPMVTVDADAVAGRLARVRP